MSDVVGSPLQDLRQRRRRISMFPVKMSAARSKHNRMHLGKKKKRSISRQRSRRDANNSWTTKMFPQMLTVARR